MLRLLGSDFKALVAGLSARSPSAGSSVNVPAEGGKCCLDYGYGKGANQVTMLRTWILGRPVVEILG